MLAHQLLYIYNHLAENEPTTSSNLHRKGSTSGPYVGASPGKWLALECSWHTCIFTSRMLLSPAQSSCIKTACWKWSPDHFNGKPYRNPAGKYAGWTTPAQATEGYEFVSAGISVQECSQAHYQYLITRITFHFFSSS